MTNFKNSIVLTIIAGMWMGQRVNAEFVVANKAHISAIATLQLPNGLVQQILKPGERWVVDAATHDNATAIKFGYAGNEKWPSSIIAQRDLKYFKNWNTIALILTTKGYHTFLDVEVS